MGERNIKGGDPLTLGKAQTAQVLATEQRQAQDIQARQKTQAQRQALHTQIHIYIRTYPHITTYFDHTTQEALEHNTRDIQFMSINSSCRLITHLQQRI